MLSKLSHVTLFVEDQDAALAFYTEKLGFEVRADINLDGFRWLTVGVKSQPDLELVLMEPKPNPMLSEEHAAMLRTLLKAGVLAPGVFQSTNCQADYEALTARGVEFVGPPQERPYGVEAVFKDSSGSWFSLTQPNGWQG